MNKNKLALGLLTVGFLLTGCSMADGGSNEVAEQSSEASIAEVKDIGVVVNVVVDGEKVSDKEIVAKEDSTLLEAMDGNIDFQEVDGFISSVEGVEQSEKDNKFWVYTVNGEQTTVGANEYELREGDQIVWELMQF